MLTLAVDEFWSRKSTIPSGIEGGSKPAPNVFRKSAASSGDFAAAFINMASFSMQDKAKLSGCIFISTNFKLHKEGSLTSNRSGTKDRI